MKVAVQVVWVRKRAHLTGKKGSIVIAATRTQYEHTLAKTKSWIFVGSVMTRPDFEKLQLCTIRVQHEDGEGFVC